MKLELKISVKTFTVVKKCLISVIIQLSQINLMIQKTLDSKDQKSLDK